MVNYPTILKLGQKDINRQFYKLINDLKSGESSVSTKVTALETTVGDATEGLVKDVADIDAAIGDETTEGTILARIKALEDAA